MDGCSKGRHWQYDKKQKRDDEQRKFDEDRDRLAVSHKLVEQRNGAVHPIDHHDDEGEEPEDNHQLSQNVSVEAGQHARVVTLFAYVCRDLSGILRQAKL